MQGRKRMKMKEHKETKRKKERGRENTEYKIMSFQKK